MRIPPTNSRQSRIRTSHITDAEGVDLAAHDVGELHQAVSFCTLWRRYPADQIAPRAEAIAEQLSRLSAIDSDLRHALRGDVIVCIRLAIRQHGARHPFSLTTDLAMTALMRCAVEGSASAKVVMPHIIKSCRFDHDRRAWLTGSWFSFKAQDGTDWMEEEAVGAVSAARGAAAASAIAGLPRCVRSTPNIA